MRERKKRGALGDDPLAWLARENDGNKREKSSPKSDRISKGRGRAGEQKDGLLEAKKESNKSIPVKSTNKSPVKIKLEPIMTMRGASVLQEQLQAALEEQRKVRIDGSSVEMLDTSILQLICAFMRTVKEQRREVAWIGISDPLINRARTLGLEKQLALKVHPGAGEA